MEEEYVGVSEDLRDPALVARDWTKEEAYGSVEPVWKKKKAPPTDFQPLLNKKYWRKFYVRDQRGGSCVAHTDAKELGIENFLEEEQFLIMSARPIYHNRPNKPAAGMSGIDGLEWCAKKGTTSEERLPSIKLRDEEMDAPYSWSSEDEAYAAKYKSGGYVTLFNVNKPGDVFDIEEVASAIETLEVGLSLHIFATGTEWKRLQPYISNPNLTYSNATVKHSLLIVDYALINDDGKWVKALICEESYANDEKNKGQRILTEEFLSKRARFVGHMLPRANSMVPAVPKPIITRDLKWGDQGEDVRQLQAYLQFKGFMSAVWTDGSPLPPTGLWKSMTAQAVRKWQVSKGLLDFQNAPDDRVVFGPKSRQALALE